MPRPRHFHRSPQQMRPIVQHSGWTPEKEALWDHPPHEVQLWLRIPSSIDTLRQLHSHMKSAYGLDLGYDEDDEESYEKLFYNPDLRSLSGMVWQEPDGSGEVGLVMWPTYWVDWIDQDFGKREHTDKNTGYTKMWRKMLQNGRLGSVS